MLTTVVLFYYPDVTITILSANLHGSSHYFLSTVRIEKQEKLRIENKIEHNFKLLLKKMLDFAIYSRWCIYSRCVVTNTM